MRFRAAILLALLFTLGLMGGTAAAQSAEIPAETLATIKMRIAPGQENLIITTLNYREPLSIEARNHIGNWLLVRTDNGTRGWVASRYVSWAIDIELSTMPVSGEVFGENPAPLADTPVTSAVTAESAVGDTLPEGTLGRALSRLNVRAGADFSAPVIDKLEYRQEIIIEARNQIGNWLLVTSLDGKVSGWVASRYVGWDEEIELTSFAVSGATLGDYIAADEESIAEAAAQIVSLVGADGKLPDGTIPGKALVQNLFVRGGAGSTFESLGRVNLNDPVFIEARSQIGDWLLIHTQDGSLRGWVASRFISWNDELIELAFFPVSGEVISE